jgi:hypothetical protein
LWFSVLSTSEGLTHAHTLLLTLIPYYRAPTLCYQNSKNLSLSLMSSSPDIGQNCPPKPRPSCPYYPPSPPYQNA